MNQCTTEIFNDYYNFILKIRLTENEKDCLLDTALQIFDEDIRTELRRAADRISFWDLPKLTDELFKAEQYGIGSEYYKSVIRAKIEAVRKNNNSDFLPPVESRAALLHPSTLGEKFEKALLDIARGKYEEAENALAELLHKHYCTDAGRFLAGIYLKNGKTEKLSHCLGETAGILRECLLLDPPEWLEKLAEKAGISICPGGENAAEKAKYYRDYTPFDPTAPAAEKERIGFI